MILGFSTFTWVHTILSLVALLAGLVVVAGLLGTRTLPQWTGLFIVTAIATSVTGFGFPFEKFEASHWIGVISLVALAGAIVARYMFHLAGAWRWIYVVTIAVAAYFLVFVTVAQAFKKVPSLHAMAPTLSEPPFAVAQLVVLVIFAAIIVAAVIKFRPAATRA